VSVAAMTIGTTLLTSLAASCPTDGTSGRVVLGGALIAWGAILLHDDVLRV
jgi:hypothetical protein